MIKKPGQLLVNLAIPLATGAIAAFLTSNAMMEFGELKQPPLSPPAWLFPVVWTILYVLMGVASYLISLKGTEREEVQQAFTTYFLQLFFNFGWSILFFELEWYLVAFLWLIVLWVLILRMILQYYAIDKTAALLMVPYLLWVTFAGYLNLGIYLLN